MTFRRILLMLVLVLLALVFARPRWVWAEARRIHSQWDTILRLLVLVVLIYLGYGLYQILAGDLAWWPF